MGQKNNFRILLIGDSVDLVNTIANHLSTAGLSAVSSATDDAMTLLRQGSPDLVLIALPLAHEHGLALCRNIRSESRVPIIGVSGRNLEQMCVDSLEAGADDYVAKPFSSRELAARIEAAIRRANAEPYRPPSAGLRSQTESEGVLRVGGVRLDLTTCRVSVDGRMRTLTPNEFRLMAIFMRAPGDVFTREDLRRRVWPDDQHSLHLVEVHIANLRAKIEADPHHPVYIVTVRSRGYKFATPSE